MKGLLIIAVLFILFLITVSFLLASFTANDDPSCHEQDDEDQLAYLREWAKKKKDRRNSDTGSR